MRYFLCLLSILLLLTSACGSSSLAAIASSIEGDERFGDLPDDPLERQPHGKADLPRKSDASVPVLHGDLTGRMRATFEAIRDALHKAAGPGDSDIPLVFNDAVDRHIRSFTGPKRDVFARWLSRAKKYEPTIREILRKNDLPEDLVYVAMIESGFNMKACSRAQAMGPWQFMDDTGRQYGLRVDYWVDERYDLEKSTVAAARYLKKLFDQFGCWYLVAASYNAGENRVRRAMENGRTKDFWELREYKMLPRETQEYVPQLIAAATIARDPDLYGFSGIRPAPVYRLTKVEVAGGVPLGEIAAVCDMEQGDLKALNPELLQGITPPGSAPYHIKLPSSARAAAGAERLEGGIAWKNRVIKVVQYRVKAKDSVSKIARIYGVTRPELTMVNADGLAMEKGRILHIPRFKGTGRDTMPKETPASKVALTSLEKKSPGRKMSRSESKKKMDDVVELRAAKDKSSLPTHGSELVVKKSKASSKRSVAKAANPKKTVRTASR
jgi:membrane-bound lytic murein transglycosylase D